MVNVATNNEEIEKMEGLMSFFGFTFVSLIMIAGVTTLGHMAGDFGIVVWFTGALVGLRVMRILDHVKF